jgi:Concanavalin A-like lectin/glucanases superfamily
MPRDIITIRRRGGYFAAVGGPSPMSLVLTAASSQYLTRTWGNAPTNNKIFTLAFWFKRLSDQAALANFYDGGVWQASAESAARFTAADTLEYDLYDGTSVLVQESDLTVLTDTTTWHHFCVAIDSTQASATNRRNLWVDGLPFGGTDIFPPLNQNMHIADNGIASAIGRSQSLTARYVDAKIAYFYLIDGQQLNVSQFASGSGAGTTHPVPYGGTFGTNGFFLNFTGSNTNDQSGNNNNWTQNNGPTFSADIPT